MLNRTLALLIATLTIGGTAATLAADHGHGHSHGDHGDHGKGSGGLTLNNGKKWVTDAPLKENMKGIRDLMEANLGKIHEKKFTDAEYTELATKIDGHLQNIFTNCKLEPETDKAAHVVLLKIIDGNKAMKGEDAKIGRRAGAIRILGALGQYGKFFEHEGWKPIKH